MKAATLIALVLCMIDASGQFKVRGRIIQKREVTAWLYCSILHHFYEPSLLIDSTRVAGNGSFDFELKEHASGTVFTLTLRRPKTFTFPENAVYFTNEDTHILFISIPDIKQLYKASLLGSKVNEDLSEIVKLQSTLIEMLWDFAEKKMRPGESMRWLVQLQVEQNKMRRKLEQHISSASQSCCLILFALYFYCALNFLALDNSGRLRNVAVGGCRRPHWLNPS